MLLKWIIEAATDIVYVIHWSETVPLITLLFAYVYQRWWRLPSSHGDGHPVTSP